MTSIIKYIYLTIFILLFGFCIFRTFSYYKINKEYNSYKERIELITDSLEYINNSIRIKLDSTLNVCDELSFKIDSLNDVKQQIIIKKESYKINDNILDGVEILKKNLECVHL